MTEQQEEKGVVKYTARDGQPIKLSPAIIRRYLVSGRSEFVTDQELYLYMGICKSRGLNPFIKDCYLVKYSQNDNAAIIVSIDYYRKRARAQEDCRGWSHGITLIDKKGNIERREGCLLLEGEILVGAWFRATPDGWVVPMIKEINLAPYVKKTKEGRPTAFWSPEKQPEQIAKVVEAQGLRAAWPDEFQGLYVDSERQSEEAQAELSATVATADNSESAPEKLKSVLGQTLDALSKKREDDAPELPTLDDAPDPEPPWVWERENWINLKQPGFSTFVHKNIETFKIVPADLQAAVIDKWHSFYEEPFPGTKIEPDPEPEEDPSLVEAEERSRMIANIKSDYNEQEIFRAKKALNWPTVSWPPTLDGCNHLLEKLREMTEEL